MAFPYKKVLMVGATSGIGRAMASRILDSTPGAHVVAVGRRATNLEELQQQHGADRVSTVVCDIGELGALTGFVQGVTAAHPDLDCVFINAGIQRGFDFCAPASFAPEQFDAELRTNYTAPVHLTHLFLPFLLAAAPRPVSLVYTTSCLAVVPLPRAPGYSASKAALHAFALSLRMQLLPHKHVKVVELMPPAVQTELHDAKHQPDIKDGRSIGMPLDEYTHKAYTALVAAGEAQATGKDKMASERVIIGGFPGIDEHERWREAVLDRMWTSMVSSKH